MSETKVKIIQPKNNESKIEETEKKAKGCRLLPCKYKQRGTGYQL